METSRLGFGAALLLGVAACGQQSVPVGLAHLAPMRLPVRPTEPNPDYGLGFGTATVLTYDDPSGLVRVHYTVDPTSPHSVPTTDANGNGVPDFVETAGATVAWAWKQEVNGLGFRAPVSDAGLAGDNGGDGRYDAYLLDFAAFNHGADGLVSIDDCTGGPAPAPIQCITHILIENDFAGYGYSDINAALKILASHEMFHAVQDAYDDNQISPWTEGTAMWAEEQLFPQQTDFEAHLPAYFQKTQRSLDDPQGMDFSYGAEIWAEFLSERFGTDIIRQIWEACVNGANGIDDPTFLQATDQVLQRDYATTLSAAFQEFSVWNLFTGDRADPARSYANGAAYPQVSLVANSTTLPLLHDTWLEHLSAEYLEVSTGGASQLDVVLHAETTPTRLTVVGQRSTGELVDLGSLDAVACKPVRQTVSTSDVARLFLVATDARPSGTVATVRVYVGAVGTDPPPLATMYRMRTCPTPSSSTKGGGQPHGGCAQTPATGAALVAVLALVWERRRRHCY